MENGLKVGQRLNLYEDESGDQAVERPGRPYWPGTVYLYQIHCHGGRRNLVYHTDDLKHIGCFIVKEVFTNLNPCTII